MYTNFFGLSDIPFSIAPNPEYLFLSPRHKEALSHLTYGLGDTGGFVLLTGEVGTGKTTISRCLLEQLPENTQVAFILNPTLSCLELLATICDELKIRYKKTGASLKYLTDKIQAKLIKNQENDINTILLIDEAQHLQPEVLEQLRLLTNLETNTKKLLQVILIGQPELQQLLQRRDLRQLAQRITARYHLLPLTKQEVAQYVDHRVSVADCQRSLFSAGAINMLYRISGGIPRIINLLCERSLALAYGENQSLVSKKIVVQAAEQALGDEYHVSHWWQKPVFLVAAGIAAIGLMGIVGFSLGRLMYAEPQLVQTPSVEQSIAVQTAQAEKAETTEAQQTVPEQVQPNSELVVKTKVAEEVKPKLELPKTEQDFVKVEAPVIEAVTESAIEQQVISAEPSTRGDVKFEMPTSGGASDDLLARFQQAIDESNQEVVEQQPVANDLDSVPSLMDMSANFQNQIPTLSFEQHIYASDGQGWVKVNGRDRYEGDTISLGLVLTHIMPQDVVLSYRGQQFTLPALTTW